MLSPHPRQSCPPAALACADLRRWVPGAHEAGRTQRPLAAWRLPRRVERGPHYVSTSFGIPIPYAVFFAPGGIAFHAGSLTTFSHGCVHLSLPSARYYHDHLPDGAEVAVF